MFIVWGLYSRIRILPLRPSASSVRFPGDAIRRIEKLPNCQLDPREGTPSMSGDMDVPPFWPPFLTFWGLNSIFLVYFFSSTNTKTIFCGIKTTNSYIIRYFRPEISFFPRSSFDVYTASQSRSLLTSAENPASQNSPQSISKLASVADTWFENGVT